jgi:hypothetical protein
MLQALKCSIAYIVEVSEFSESLLYHVQHQMLCQVMFGCTDRPDEPGILRTRCAPTVARQADNAGRGGLLLDWTKYYNYAAAPSRHLRHRPVAAAQSHDSDSDSLLSHLGCGLPASSRPRASLTSRAAPLGTALQPPGRLWAPGLSLRRLGYGLPAAGRPGISTLSRRSPDTARQPPGRARAPPPMLQLMRIRPASRRSATGLDPLTRRSPDTDCRPQGRARACRPMLQLIRIRLASRRTPTVTESAGSDADAAHLAGWHWQGPFKFGATQTPSKRGASQPRIRLWPPAGWLHVTRTPAGGAGPSVLGGARRTIPQCSLTTWVSTGTSSRPSD